jgi:hypothetical protein
MTTPLISLAAIERNPEMAGDATVLALVHALRRLHAAWSIISMQGADNILAEHGITLDEDGGDTPAPTPPGETR